MRGLFYKIICKKLKKTCGQSILEFAIILPFVFFFIFLHIQLCISYVLMKYANYISFMSARTVLTNGHLANKHIGVKQKYLPGLFGNIIRMEDPKLINYNPLERSFYYTNNAINEGTQWSNIKLKDNENRNVGVELSYSIPVFLPFLRELSENLSFRLRTVLGREPHHGSGEIDPWRVNDPYYGDSYGTGSACGSVYNDNGC